MTNKAKVYTKVMEKIKTLLPTMSQNRLVTLSMLVTGIVIGGKSHLSEVSLHIPHDAKPQSLEKRFRRFVKNDRIDVETIFLPFAQLVLQQLGDERLFLMIDGSTVGRGCMTLMVGVVYKQRALPLAWIVYRGKKGHASAARHIEVLEIVKRLLPENSDVVLLGDGEFDAVDLLQWVTDHTDWHFVVRSSPHITITQGDLSYRLDQLLSTHDSMTTVKDVDFTHRCFSPVTAVAWWERPHKKPIYLLSNHSNPADITDWYRKRMLIETLFSDKKSRGFNIHKSHLSHPARLARLLLATAIAYIWMVCLGVSIQIEETYRSIVDRKDRTDKSLFRLGLDWIKLVLTRGYPLRVSFAPPKPSPPDDSFVHIAGVR